jgi:hypothetical protein
MMSPRLVQQLEQDCLHLKPIIQAMEEEEKKWLIETPISCSPPSPQASSFLSPPEVSSSASPSPCSSLPILDPVLADKINIRLARLERMLQVFRQPESGLMRPIEMVFFDIRAICLNFILERLDKNLDDRLKRLNPNIEITQSFKIFYFPKIMQIMQIISPPDEPLKVQSNQLNSANNSCQDQSFSASSSMASSPSSVPCFFSSMASSSSSVPCFSSSMASSSSSVPCFSSSMASSSSSVPCFSSSMVSPQTLLSQNAEHLAECFFCLNTLDMADNIESPSYFRYCEKCAGFKRCLDNPLLAMQEMNDVSYGIPALVRVAIPRSAAFLPWLKNLRE